MAYYNEENENEDQQDPGQPAQLGAQSATISSSSGAPQGATPQGATKSPDRSNAFVGIKDYINANKTQAGKLGDQAANVINQSAQNARGSVNELENTFNQKAGQAVQADQNALGKLNQAETLNDNERQSLKNQFNAQYQGPSSLTDLNDQYASAQQKLNTAKQNVQGASTEEGRKGLISQVNSRPRTAGMDNFDNVLLSAGGGREKVEQAAQANKDVTGDVLGEKNASAQQRANEIKAQTDATRQTTQTAVQQAQAAQQAAIEQRLKDFQNQLIQKNNAIATDLGDQNSLDQATMDALGLSEGQRLYNLDLNNYFTQLDPTAVTREGVANQEDLLRAQALADIAGTDSFLGSEGIGSASEMNPLNREALWAAIEGRNQELSPQYAQQMQSILDSKKAIEDFRSDPLKQSAYMGGMGMDSFNNPIMNAPYQQLKQALADREAALKQWESSTGFNRTAKRSS